LEPCGSILFPYTTLFRSFVNVCRVLSSGLDLASLLDGEQGLFLCQNRGQNYITVAKAGHSIAFGPTPIGKAVQEQVSPSVGPERSEEHTSELQSRENLVC